jgi:hypothetical protein
MLESINKDVHKGINIARIEERLIETKNLIRRETMIEKEDNLNDSNNKYEELGYDSGHQEGGKGPIEF